MWVADIAGDKIYAYRMDNKARDSGKDFDTLSAAGNNAPIDIWSDRTIMWVADFTDKKIYAYNLSTKARDDTKDFNTLSAAGNDGVAGIWSDGTTMWVVDTTLEGNKLFSYNKPVFSTDPTLSSITVNGNAVPDFDPDRTSYEYGVANTVTRATIAATTANSAATWAVTSPADAASNRTGHQVDLSTGSNAVTITGTAEDGSTQEYTLNVNRGVTTAYGWKVIKDFDTLIAAGNVNLDDIWSDGTTMWVADIDDDKLYAYDLSTRSRDSGKDFNTLEAAGNASPAGIWSDGTTMWVGDYTDDKIYAYRMSNKRRDSGKDFNMLDAAENNHPVGIWSDGTTMWVADLGDDKIYAYNLSTKARDDTKDFDTLKAAGNVEPVGIWSWRVSGCGFKEAIWAGEWCAIKLIIARRMGVHKWVCRHLRALGGPGILPSPGAASGDPSRS